MQYASDISLGELKAGQHAVITRMEADGTLGMRFREMGFLPGTHVEMVRAAPLGDPIELRLRGFLIAVRRSDLKDVRGRVHA